MIPDRYTLLLMRHARSSWSAAGERDHSRPLDEDGRQQASAIGAALAPRLPGLRHIVCSTARRARETLERVLADRSLAAELHFSDDLYALGESAYADAARRFLPAGPTLLVGHNPTIERFCASLLIADPEGLRHLADGYGTATVAAVSGSFGPDGAPDLGAGRLEEWIVP